MAYVGGSNCCIVGCHTSSGKCRGLSFLSMPKPGISPEQDQWRSKLISVINRCDSSFNPTNAKICSRHFDDGQIKIGPSGKCAGLEFGSLPRHWMPAKSIETPKPPARPEPTFREPPIVPVRVVYMDLDDVRKDLKRIPAPWIIKEENDDIIQVGLSTENSWKIVVSVRSTTAEVKVFGSPAAHLTTNLEDKKLCVLLQELQDKTLCSGVTEAELQHYAEPEGNAVYYRHIQNGHADGKVHCTSTVRSTQCHLLIMDSMKCTACHHVEKLLKEKKANIAERLTGPLKENDPLHGLSKQHLKCAFKRARGENVKLKAKVARMEEQLVLFEQATLLP